MACRLRSYSARMPALDTEEASSRWYCAVRDGIVETYGEDEWALTDHGWEVAYRRAFSQGADPDDLSDGQLISLAVYGTPDMG